MESKYFRWLISELCLLKNKYKYLVSVNGSYNPQCFCYIVYFNCDFCGDFFTFPVSIADDEVIDMDTVEKIVTTFTDEYFAYEKYFT